MSFYQDVRDGLLKVTLILAVPRSVSTALTRSLSQSPDIDGFVVQPFSLWGSGEVRAVDRCVSELKINRTPTPENPLHIVIKDMAFGLSFQRFHHLIKHCENIVVLNRDPQLQAFSLVKAFNRESGGGRLTLDELGQVRKSDIKGSVAGPGWYNDYWQSLEDLVDYLDRSQHSSSVAVIDGDVIRAFPEWSLEQLSQVLNLRYDSDMGEGWESLESGENPTLDRLADEWVGRAKRTKQFHPPSLETPSLDQLPQSLREVVGDHLSTYAWLMAHEQAIHPSVEQIAQLLPGGSGNKSFAELCPVAAYTTAALSDDRALIAQVREQRADLASSFTEIDQTFSL